MPHAADSSTTTTSSSSSTSNVPPLHHPNFNRGWSRRRHHRNNNNANNKTTTTNIHPNELSVTHLRRIYSTLLEEMAPSVHNGGTPDGKHYRWKNSGTVTMMGDDTEGYEYSYTPDNSQKSWRLANTTVGGIGAAAKALDDSKNGSLGGGVGGGGIIGITGGDWATDGIRRYHTGGSILVIEPPHHHHQSQHQSQQHFADDEGLERGIGDGTSSGGGGGDGERSSNILRVGSMNVDVGTMNGVQLSPVKQQLEETTMGEATVVDEQDEKLESKFSIDDDENDDDDAAAAAAAGSTAKTLHESSQLDSENELTEVNVQDNTDTLQDAPPPPTVVVDDSTILESVLGEDEVVIESLRQTSHHATTTSGSNQNTTSPNPPTDKSKHGDISTTTAISLFDNGLLSFNPSSLSSSSNNTMTTFESLYHLSPSMAWRLRSAYAPITPQEEHFMSVGSEILTQRHPDKADGIMRGLAVARQCESRVCDGLRKLGELISYCERIKGSSSRNFLSTNTMDNSNGADDDDEEEDVNDEDIEAAEAMFAYFCEKNVLPMLIDSLLCHPPALSASDTILNAVSLNSICVESSSLSQPPPSSPFSGVNWTASVKSQILQTIAMILFNTSSPLSLTYLLSNNYMNELIMGMLPLDRWRVDALEELLPPYVTLLRGLVMRLRGDEGRYCLPLLLCQRQRRNTLAKSNDNSNENTAEVDTTETYLPLLYAAVQVFCSSFGTSLRDSEGCLIRTTAMNVILNLARISDPEMRMVLVVGGGDAMDGSVLPTTKSTPTTTPAAAGALSLLMSSPMTLEQELLFPHICNSLNSWFHRSVRLVMASLSIDDKSKHHDAKLEAKARHKDIAEVQFRELQYWLGFLDDLLSCDIRIWNARLVEWILREVVVGTVLLRWNRSLDIVGKKSSDRSKSLPEIYKAHAEIRVSIVFLTQLFGMIEYSPLVRLVGALVLHPKYPSRWCGLGNEAGVSGAADFARGDGFFVITTAINSMINETTAASGTRGEEADAGAGRQPNLSSESKSQFQDTCSSKNQEDGRTLETVEQEHAGTDLSMNPYSIGDSSNLLIPSRHRAAILDMLAGRYSPDETVLASMLLATILENDAIDDYALEIFGVLPSPTVNDDGNSPFEQSIATYLTKDWTTVDSKSYLALGSAIESVSTLGMMLTERLVFHTWTEQGQCIDVIPFHHYFKSSAFIAALRRCLSCFVSRAQSHLHDSSSVCDTFSDLIRRRYCSTLDVSNSPRHSKESAKSVCLLQSYYPSNFIDNVSVLTGDIVYGGAANEDTSRGDLFLVDDENEAAKFEFQATLHLRSILGCINDFYQRFSHDSGSPWYSGGDSFAFSTTEEADEVIMSIGGIESISLPTVGTDIDLRGRKFFLCSLPVKSKHGFIGSGDIVICANGTKISVTEKSDLVFIVEAMYIFVAMEKMDYNRCTVLSVIPIRTIVASATEGEIFHVVCHANELLEQQGNIIKDGRLSLRFGRGDTCVSVKECVDKHFTAFENKIMLDISEMLGKCLLIGSDANLSSSLQSIDIEDSWCDFQQA